MLDHEFGKQHIVDTPLRERLFRHQVTFDGTALGQCIPYYVNQKSEWLSDEMKTRFFKAALGWMYFVCAKFFKQRQTSQTLVDANDVDEYMLDRVFLFIDHLPKYKNTKWDCAVAVILSTYEKEFQYYEALLQFRRLGIGLPTVDKHGVPFGDNIVFKQSQSRMVKDFVLYTSWKRSRVTYFHTYFTNRYKRDLDDYSHERYMRRFNYLVTLIKESCGASHYRLAFFTDDSVDFNSLDGYYK